MESTNNSKTLHTLGGVPLAFLTWLVIYAISHAALYLLDSMRDLDDDWLQNIFRQLVTPGIGGFVAVLCVDKYLPKANLYWVTIIYCFPVVALYILVSLYIIIFEGSSYEFSWGEQMLGWGLAFSTCIGSYIGIRRVNSRQ